MNRSQRQQATSAAPLVAARLRGTRSTDKRMTPEPEAASIGEAPALVMTDYYRALGMRLERRKRYPRMAVKQRQQGTVKLRLLIAADGSLLSADVIAASKHRTLNEAATRLARDSSPYPVPPIGADTPLEIRVPISYHLR
jgi:protein TonB